MNLIMSGAYLNAEFTAEFGQLPPGFLPVGNKRLYRWQIDAFAPTGDRVVMALPAGFELLAYDRDWLDAAGVEIVPVPIGLSLGAAIVYCLNVCRPRDEFVRLLHGDTLVETIAAGPADIVLTAETSEYYNWAEYELDPSGTAIFREGLPTGRRPRQVLCGYFAFTARSVLIESIVKSDNHFIRGLNAYARRHPLKPVPTRGWHDFGHVQLYYQSKSRMTTERAFNSLRQTRRIVTKSSSDPAKIHAEASWYEGLPGEARTYTPAFIGRGEPDLDRVAYRTEYLHLSTLAELYVFGKLPTFVWSRILAGCDEFLSLEQTFAAPQPIEAARSESYRDKTLDRLEMFAASNSGIRLDQTCRFGNLALPSLRSIAETCAAAIPGAASSDMTLWHGDFCFSNIFYDFRAGQIRTIDPRGRNFQGKVSIFGDRRYDLAKLTHSVIGRYDFIIAGYCAVRSTGPLDFELEFPEDGTLRDIEAEFRQSEIGGYRVGDPWVLAMTVGLFLSMLPLHADNPQRQRAMLANALRLFAALDR